MIHSDRFKDIFDKFFIKHKPKDRKMKRVFQWKRYLQWKDLTIEEKLSTKRFLLIPVFAYLIVGILNHNLSFIVLFLVGYVLYTKFQSGKIEKK